MAASCSGVMLAIWVGVKASIWVPFRAISSRGVSALMLVIERLASPEEVAVALAPAASASAAAC